MKRTISILVAAFLSLILFNQSGKTQNCIFCNSNTVGDSSSAIGAENISTGKYSLASGYLNNATGGSSLAAGFSNSSLGNSSISLGFSCIANGLGAFAAGRNATANGNSSFALGKYVNTGESVYGSFVIGQGSSETYSLNNTLSNTLMIGFISTRPTFFVSASNGYDKTGKIGIGNITEPEAKLHIKADNNEDASLFLQSTGANYFGKLMLGDESHIISSKTGENLKFETEIDKDFVFKNGSLFIEDSFEGLILKSPDGQCWKGTADNTGSFILESINCNLITGEDKTPSALQAPARIFPNPAGNKLTVELPSDIQQAFASFYNEQGILLLQKEITGGNNLISLKKLPLGILVVKVFIGNGELISVEKVLHQ